MSDRKHQEYLELLDALVHMTGDAIAAANVALARDEQPAAVTLDFLERIEMIRSYAEHRLPSRWRVN
jgi:hypothetical protein